MLLLHFIAEERIARAVADGELDNLPGQGRPLDLDDEDPLWPEEVRMARRILRNAGFDDADLVSALRPASTRRTRSPS